jgi:acyl-CoA synthetase (AMP-forming)/AMP-acid ligase II
VIVAGDGTLPAGAVSLAALLVGPRRDEPLPLISTDLAAIIYTSGSTGRPKGVTLTHLNIDTVCESVEEYLENSSDDVILSVLQLSFGYGLLQLLVTFRTGGTLVLEKGFGYPYDIVNTLKEQRITGFAGVPTLFALLLQLSTLAQERFPHLRYITNAAAAMPQSFIPRLRQLFPQTRIYLMHGLTEVLRTTYLPPDQLDTRPASVGRGMKNVELWIEDEDGKRLGPGEVGELVVRGANVMAGYWDDPEATSKVLLPGRYSWERVMHSGDLFTMDEEGYFSFVARKDDIIKCRGEKVSPLEVENVLYRLEGVLECRVIGVADPLLGQAVRAEIVLKPESSLVESAVRAHCRMHLEDYKVPQVIAFVDALPKTAGGKIRRTP